MKKTILTLAIVLGMTVASLAQSDGFFKESSGSLRDGNGSGEVTPNLPGLNQGNQDAAPLDCGLLILTAMGAGYVMLRKKAQ